MVVLKNTGIFTQAGRGLGGGELGDCLGALGHSVLGQLAGQDEAHGGLDLPRGHGGLLAVARVTLRLSVTADTVFVSPRPFLPSCVFIFLLLQYISSFLFLPPLRFVLEIASFETENF